jgi:hypothetical protein
MTTDVRHTGRARRVCEYLKSTPSGASLRALVIALEPGCKPANMAGTVCTLEQQQKVRRESINGITTFFATDLALVDRRIKANQVPKRKRRQDLTKQKAARGEQVRRRPSTPQAKPARSSPLGHRSVFEPRVRSMHLGGAVDAKQHERDEIAAAIDVFLSRGGQIQRYAQGETAASIAEREAALRHTYRRRRAPTAA